MQGIIIFDSVQCYYLCMCTIDEQHREWSMKTHKEWIWKTHESHWRTLILCLHYTVAIFLHLFSYIYMFFDISRVLCLLSPTGQHSSPWTWLFVCDGVSCCMTHGTSSHFPLYSFHVSDSTYYYVWEDLSCFGIPGHVLVMCRVRNPVTFTYFKWYTE
jgi:hypothetical protein